MAVQQAPAGIVPPSADVVAKAFVHQYYLILHQSPEHVHRFYQDISKLGRPEENGLMGITSTMQAINEKILSLGQFRAEIITIDAQQSFNGGVLVLVTGYLTGSDGIRRKFTQSFFLAPQDKGYFVLNDIFRYVEEPTFLVPDPGSVTNVAEPSPEQNLTSHDNHNSEHIASLLEEAGSEEVYNPSENGDGSVVEEEVPIAEVVDATPSDAEIVVESVKLEDTPKKSYASIVKVMKEGSAQVPSSVGSPLKSVAPKSQEQQLNTLPPPAPVPAPAPTPALAPTSETQDSSSKATEDGNGQEVESDGHSIYLKGLPINATHPQVESEFSKFGTIKTGGIQIRSQKGFCFGFVEYEDRSAAESAIEASPITMGGRQVVVEPKKSTSRGTARERFSSGRGGGYRNDGPRGRGNYGGNRSYNNRGEMNNKVEFGNRNVGRGGYSYRNDGYHRADHNGTRPHRASGFNDGDAPHKTAAPRVTATA